MFLKEKPSNNIN